jgi:hypothetical protein
MEQWEIDFNWLKVQHFVKDTFLKQDLPKLDTILFMIGLQEFGEIHKDFTKEDKLAITTLGMCEVLSEEGYFEKKGIDADGWPNWIEIKPFKPQNDIEAQIELKRLTILYFENYYNLDDYIQQN